MNLRRLPGNVNFSFSNPGNINLLMELDARGIPHEQVRIDEYTGKRFMFFSDPDDLPIELYEQ